MTFDRTQRGAGIRRVVVEQNSRPTAGSFRVDDIDQNLKLSPELTLPPVSNMAEVQLESSEVQDATPAQPFRTSALTRLSKLVRLGGCLVGASVACVGPQPWAGLAGTLLVGLSTVWPRVPETVKYYWGRLLEGSAKRAALWELTNGTGDAEQHWELTGASPLKILGDAIKFKVGMERPSANLIILGRQILVNEAEKSTRPIHRAHIDRIGLKGCLSTIAQFCVEKLSSQKACPESPLDQIHLLSLGNESKTDLWLLRTTYFAAEREEQLDLRAAALQAVSEMFSRRFRKLAADVGIKPRFSLTPGELIVPLDELALAIERDNFWLKPPAINPAEVKNVAFDFTSFSSRTDYASKTLKIGAAALALTNADYSSLEEALEVLRGWGVQRLVEHEDIHFNWKRNERDCIGDWLTVHVSLLASGAMSGAYLEHVAHEYLAHDATAASICKDLEKSDVSKFLELKGPPSQEVTAEVFDDFVLTSILFGHVSGSYEGFAEHAALEVSPARGFFEIGQRVFSVARTFLERWSKVGEANPPQSVKAMYQPTSSSLTSGIAYGFDETFSEALQVGLNRENGNPYLVIRSPSYPVRTIAVPLNLPVPAEVRSAFVALDAIASGEPAPNVAMLDEQKPLDLINSWVRQSWFTQIAPRAMDYFTRGQLHCEDRLLKYDELIAVLDSLRREFAVGLYATKSLDSKDLGIAMRNLQTRLGQTLPIISTLMGDPRLEAERYKSAADEGRRAANS